MASMDLDLNGEGTFASYEGARKDEKRDKGKGRAMDVETESEFEREPSPAPLPLPTAGRAKVSRRPAGPWPSHLSAERLAELLKRMRDAADAYNAHQATLSQPPFFSLPLSAQPPLSSRLPLTMAAPLVLIRDERMRRRAHADQADLLWVEYCEAREGYAQIIRAREMDTLPDIVIYNLHRAFKDNIVQGPPFDGRRRLAFPVQGDGRRRRTDSVEI